MQEFKIIIDPEMPSKPYLPYLAAVESGVVEPDELVPQHLDEPLGVLLQNCQIPTEQAGLIVVGGQTHVCDHASVIDSGKDRLFLGPSSKNDVASGGEIRDSGLLVLTRPNGLLRIIGMAINSAENPWLVRTNNLGGIAVKMFGIEAIDYEPTDVDKDGIITAKKLRY